MSEDQIAAREELVDVARSLFQRGYSFGTAGNISVRCGQTILCTPTGSSLGTLKQAQISQCDLAGNRIGGDKPTKELPFHLAVYDARESAKAVVHLHSTYATAVCCLRDLNGDDALSVLTPYYGMRISHLPVVPYFPPGDPELGVQVRDRVRTTNAVLLRNHGSIAVGETLAEAASLAEEIEEAARLFFILGDRGQPLSSSEVAELRNRFR